MLKVFLLCLFSISCSTKVPVSEQSKLGEPLPVSDQEVLKKPASKPVKIELTLKFDNPKTTGKVVLTDIGDGLTIDFSVTGIRPGKYVFVVDENCGKPQQRNSSKSSQKQSLEIGSFETEFGESLSVDRNTKMASLQSESEMNIMGKAMALYKIERNRKVRSACQIIQ